MPPLAVAMTPWTAQSNSGIPGKIRSPSSSLRLNTAQSTWVPPQPATKPLPPFLLPIRLLAVDPRPIAIPSPTFPVEVAYSTCESTPVTIPLPPDDRVATSRTWLPSPTSMALPPTLSTETSHTKASSPVSTPPPPALSHSTCSTRVFSPGSSMQHAPGPVILPSCTWVKWTVGAATIPEPVPAWVQTVTGWLGGVDCVVVQLLGPWSLKPFRSMVT